MSELLFILDNKVNNLTELGFTDLQAIELCEAGIDWHYAKRLIESGCSAELAMEILL